MKQCVTFLFLLIGISCFSNWAFCQARGPASQPSKTKYPRVSCHDWDKHLGKEGACLVETKTTTWELGYYLEGTEKRDMLGRTKNIVLLFRPAAEDHKVFSWWKEAVGPKKAIDTRKWLVVSLGVLGDGLPKKGSDIFLTSKELFVVQQGVLDYLFPYRSKIALVGGVSQGSVIALMWARELGKGIRKLLLVSGGLTRLGEIGFNPLIKSVEDVLRRFRGQFGPYDLWAKDKKLRFWTEVIEPLLGGGFLYPKGYFDDPKNMKEVGKTPKEYKGPAYLKSLVAQQWAAWYMEKTHPKWQLAQTKMIHGIAEEITDDVLVSMKGFRFAYLGVENALKEGEKAKLESRVEKFRKGSEKPLFELIQDERGENAVYSPDIAQGVLDFVKKYLAL